MKDMTLKDILFREDRPLTSLSLYRDGRWIFAAPTNLTKTTAQQAFYLISEPFGLLRQGTSNPKIRAVTGAPGDYLAVNSVGVYSLIKKEEYARQFPSPNLNPPTNPNNSSQIKDKNFLTNILKGSGSAVSNNKISKPTPPNSGY
jgi:hypothetical protein